MSTALGGEGSPLATVMLVKMCTIVYSGDWELVFSTRRSYVNELNRPEATPNIIWLNLHSIKPV